VTESALKELIRTRPERRLRLGVVYVEDIYETAFGDGYFSYPQRVFFSLGAAQRCAEWVTTRSEERVRQGGDVGYRAEARPIEVVLDAADKLRVPRPAGAEGYNWEEIKLISLIQGNDPDWITIIRHCLVGAAEMPDFRDTAPGGEMNVE